MKTPKRAPERPRGRPLDSDQPDLKVYILDIAEDLFTNHGYTSTSIRHIADKAGVNPALVHYYFGSKKELLLNVMERSLKPLMSAVAELKDGPASSPEAIAGLLLSMAAAHPNIPRLLTREVLLPGGEMQAYFAEHMAPRLGGVLPALLAREKAAGRMRADADPAISALAILAVCLFPFVARPLAESVLGIGFDEDGIEKLKKQVTQILRRGLTQ